MTRFDRTGLLPLPCGEKAGVRGQGLRKTPDEAQARCNAQREAASRVSRNSSHRFTSGHSRSRIE